MKNLRIIICILLHVTVFCFASEEEFVLSETDSEEEFVLSKEDDEWLGYLIHTLSDKPQVDIASHIGRTMYSSSTIDDFPTHLQKNINHAKNWLHYFDKEKKLHAGNHGEFYRTMRHLASDIKRLAGEDQDVESRVFLELLPLVVVDIDSFSSSRGNNIFPYVIQELLENSNLMNGFIYSYNPSFDCFLMNKKKQEPCLSLIVNILIKWSNDQQRFKEIFTPTMYELTGDKVIRNTYKDVQGVACKRRAAETLLLALKAKKIKTDKPVLKGIILKDILDASIENYPSHYKAAIKFNNYCNKVEKEIGSQIEWIQKNDPEYYKKTLIYFYFLKSPEAFKEWYEGLKFPKEEK